MACCSKTQTEDQKQQVLAWHGSHRIQDLVPESNNPLPAQDSMAYGIEQLTNEGIESLQKSAGLDAQLSFSLNVHREKFEEFSMLYVTVIGTWVGQYLYPEIIKGKSNGSTKKAAQSSKARPGRELIQEQDFPIEVKAAADQLRGLASGGPSQAAGKEGKQKEVEAKPIKSQQTFSVPAEPVVQAETKKQASTSVPPSSGDPGEGPSLSGVFDD